MDAKNHPALIAWKRFYDEMHAWELRMVEFNKRNMDEMTEAEWDQFMEEQSRSLAALFDRHCVERAHAPRLAEPLSYPSAAPEYDQTKEIVADAYSVNDNEFYIETRQSHAFKLHFRYKMIESNGEWRVCATRESRPSEKDTWRKRSI